MNIHEAVHASYEDVAYVGRPNHHSHPSRLAAIARLFGVAAPDPATARVLEVGCGDGANLLPMALAHPRARFTGLDPSKLLMSRARAIAGDLGLANVELVEQDLRALDPRHGPYDYVVAHGFYSWVPPDVRDAMLRVAGARLAPGGLAFVSYNVLPGSHLRRVMWDAFRFGLPPSSTGAARVEAARELAGELVDAWSRSGRVSPQLAAEFADLPGRTESAIAHDDLSPVNDAVHVTRFARHAAGHGLAFLAEAEPSTMAATGLPPRLQQEIARSDPLAREQWLDFARVRKFRQSILARAPDVAQARFTPAAIDGLQLSASTTYVQERERGRESAGDPLLDLLVDAYPATLPAVAIVERLAAAGRTPGQAREAMVRCVFAGSVDPYALPLAPAPVAGDRPTAFPFARWQAARREILTNLRHEGVRLDDDVAFALLAGCDGTRDRQALAALVPAGAGPVGEVVDHYLERFALAALLID